MAIIAEHEEDNQQSPPGSPSKSKPRPKPNTQQPQSPTPPSPNRQNPFKFWFYFTATVTISTIILTTLSSTLSPTDPKQWFLSLSPALRTHFSNGRQIKVQLNSHDPPVELFTYSKGSGPHKGENVLIVPGLGCSSYTFKRVVDGLAKKGVFAVAVDLPGVGFSDKSVERMRESGVDVLGGGIVGWVRDVYEEIQEKGIFWGLDNLVEHGYVPVEEIEKSRRERRERSRRVLSKKIEALELGGEDVSRVLSQVVDTLGLGKVHLVLHDSALVMGGSSWVAENVGLFRSVTLVDSWPRGTILPLWAIEVPVVREVVLGFGYVFRKLVEGCCVRDGVVEVEAHRVLLKGRDGRKAVVGMGKKLNSSFDLSEWVGLDGVKELPMQVLWSSGWSDEWSEEGRWVAETVSQGRLVEHSGGRWPQDESSDVIAENIASFVSSLPRTVRKAQEEPVPEHIKKMLDEATSGGHHHEHGHDNHGHHHEHIHEHGAHAGYEDAYGLGQGHGWAM